MTIVQTSEKMCDGCQTLTKNCVTSFLDDFLLKIK